VPFNYGKALNLGKSKRIEASNAHQWQRKIRKGNRSRSSAADISGLRFGEYDKEIDLVAQLVEHYTFNVRVLGSNPSGITSKHKTIVRPLEFQVVVLFCGNSYSRFVATFQFIPSTRIHLAFVLLYQICEFGTAYIPTSIPS
jgi:hypothetical protein